MHVGSVDKLASTSSGWPLQIHGKNFLNVTFVIPKEKDCQDIYTSLTRLSQPGCHVSSVLVALSLSQPGCHVSSVLVALSLSQPGCHVSSVLVASLLVHILPPNTGWVSASQIPNTFLLHFAENVTAWLVYICQSMISV